MSGTVVSKNLYELLGNTHDEDSDKEPEPPVKVIDKTPARTTKRNAPGEAPASKAPSAADARGGRRGHTGNEAAYRDRNTGRSFNKDKPTGDENARPDRRMDRHSAGTYEGRGRGGRTGRGGAYDRHSRGVGGDSEKQAAHGWGANEGGAELADEQAGEAIAKADEKEALTGDAEGGEAIVEAAEPEPEDNSVSYADYLAQQAEKKLALGKLEVRQVDESKVDKKWANAKAVTKEEEEDFVAGSGGKAKRERERTAKNVKVDIDQRYVEPPREERGGRGGFRGGRGRGEGQRGGARGEFRGGRGGERGGRGRGGDKDARGPPRGGPRSNNNGPALKIDDNSAFPSLGA